MKRERRYSLAKELRVQTTETGEKVIAGYAVVYNSLSEDMGFREMIAPGAFKTLLATNPDVRCLFNHDDSLILGRTSAGTLTLSDDSKGLAFRCVLPDTSTANDLAVSIERGDISQCSFGFIADTVEWSEQPGYQLRTITAIARLTDVSPVCYPAYTATSVSMRTLFPDGAIEVPAKETRDDGDQDDTINDETVADDLCACQCAACIDGDCADCSDELCSDPMCRCSEMRTNKALAQLITRQLRYI